MSRGAPSDISLAITLERKGGAAPISDQIAAQIRAATLTRALRCGDRLPSIRALAARLTVARATVDAAYAQLVAEGYLETRTGSGTRNEAPLTQETLSVSVARRTIPAPSERSIRRALPAHAAELAAMARTLLVQQPIPFAAGIPTAELSPGKAWTRIATRLARAPWRHAGYAAPHGYGPLREHVADYARRMRGVQCDPDQVIITAGTQQGLSLCARVLFTPGDAVWLENPCYQPLVGVLRNAQLEPVAVPVDGKGLVADAGIARAPEARGAFVTPSHQFPLGMVMSMERRLALLNWAQGTGSWIVEDDYDSELRYAGRPFPALQGLDGASDAVVYLGTFSKTLFPGLRLGYMITPRRLVDAFAGARLLADRQSSSAEQTVLAEFMAGGHYEAHVRRIRLIFAERRNVLLQECQSQLAGFGTMAVGDQGMHVVFHLHAPADDLRLADTLRRKGIEVRALSPFYTGETAQHGLLLGFGSFQPEAIRMAVRRLRSGLEWATAGASRQRLALV